MADTLTEYAKLAGDEVSKGIIEEIITQDALMTRLKFKSFTGNAYIYNRELTLPGGSTTHAVGDNWQTIKPTFNKKTASLVTVGGQSGIDMYIEETRSNLQDPQSILMKGLAKDLTREFARLVIKGEPEVNALEFEGLDSLLRSETRMMAMDDGAIDGPGTAETELTLPRFDAAIDQVDDGRTKPDILLMNSTMRRKLTALARAAGSGLILNNIESFGHKVSTYDGIPIIINNFITDAEQYNDSSTWPSSTATTIFALKLGEENQGYTILHHGPVLQPRVRDLGIPRDEEIHEFRMLVYVQAILYSTKQVIALGGIDSTA